MDKRLLHRVSASRRNALAHVEHLDRRAEQWVYQRAARADAPLFAEVERFALFVGFPRSGSSLVGALLDAHPDLVIASELGALRKVAFGYSREALYASLMKADRRFAARGAVHQDDDYAVAGQWQGRVRHLRVIGDKHAENSSDRLRRDPTLIDQLRATVGVPVRVIVVVRHPLDNIARMARRGDATVLAAAARFDALAIAVGRVVDELGRDVLVMHHEDTVTDPAAALRRLAGFLEVEAPADWVDACAALVLPAPRLARSAVEWSPAERALVDEMIERYPFLHRYAEAQP